MCMSVCICKCAYTDAHIPLHSRRRHGGHKWTTVSLLSCLTLSPSSAASQRLPPQPPHTVSLLSCLTASPSSAASQCLPPQLPYIDSLLSRLTASPSSAALHGLPPQLPYSDSLLSRITASPSSAALLEHSWALLLRVRALTRRLCPDCAQIVPSTASLGEV
jgi:hypothetical protein